VRPDFAFLGSAWYSVRILGLVAEAGLVPKLVITNPPKPKGRGHELSPNPVEEAAEGLFIPVEYDPKSLMEADIDFALVGGFGRIIKAEVLKSVYLLNIHFSDLPRYRGPAPVERAILDGAERIGVTLLEVTEEVDAGPIYRTEYLDINPEEDLTSIQVRAAELGARMFIEEVRKGLDRGGPIGMGEPVEQTGTPTYAPKLKKEDLALNFGADPAQVLARIRLGRAYAYLGSRRVIVLRARRTGKPSGSPAGTLEVEGARVLVATGGEMLELVRVKPEGGREMDASEWVRGLRVSGGPLVLRPSPGAEGA
jgi:methionyl-tRNA formyltransferase